MWMSWARMQHLPLHMSASVQGQHSRESGEFPVPEKAPVQYLGLRIDDVRQLHLSISLKARYWRGQTLESLQLYPHEVATPTGMYEAGSQK